MCVDRVRAGPHPINTGLLFAFGSTTSCSARHTVAAASKGKSTVTTGAPMTDGTKEKAPARRRGKPIEVWVTDEEKATITARAKEAGMARSAYLRALGLNTPVKSVVDLGAVSELAKVSGDLGRVAGLLKLWLAQTRGEGANAIDVESIMVEFRRLQVAIGMKMGAIVKAHK